MAQEARISQWVTIIVGETPPVLELAPTPAVVGAGAPACQLVFNLTPGPAGAVVTPLAVDAGGEPIQEPAVLTLGAPDVSVIVGEIPPPPVPTCTGLRAPAYLGQLQQFLPRGAAWTRERDAVLTRLLEGFACEFACIEERAAALLAESDPRETTEMLPDWEDAAGLPDECALEAIGVSRRRSALVERLTSMGGASPKYFEAVALALGFVIEVLEFHPLVAGSNAGDALTTAQNPAVAGSNAGVQLTNNTDWAFTWAVNAPLDNVVYATAGGSSAGDPLAEWGNSILECVLQELAPAHTFLLFQYYRLLQPGPAGVTLVGAPVSVS